MGDSISQIASQSFGGFLSAVGESFAPKAQVRASDVQESQKQDKWDWRMIGIIGAVAVVLVVVMMRRK
jgi:hypothetical protein